MFNTLHFILNILCISFNNILWSRPVSHIVDVAFLWIRPGSHIVDVAFLWIRPGFHIVDVAFLWIRPGSHIVDVAMLWIRLGSHIVDFAFLWIRPRSWFWETSYKLFLQCGPAAGVFFPVKNAFLGQMACHIRENAHFISPYGPGPGPRPPYGPGPGPGPPPPFPNCPPMCPGVFYLLASIPPMGPQGRALLPWRRPWLPKCARDGFAGKTDTSVNPWI